MNSFSFLKKYTMSSEIYYRYARIVQYLKTNYIILSFQQAEREKSWLSGNFYKQRHDKKHTAFSQHRETGSSAAPWRSIRPSNTALSVSLWMRATPPFSLS